MMYNPHSLAFGNQHSALAPLAPAISSDPLTPLSGQALGQRWLILPLASLGVGGSLPVTIGLSGAFVAYALVVLVADAAAALSLRGAPRAPLTAAAAAVRRAAAGSAVA